MLGIFSPASLSLSTATFLLWPESPREINAQIIRLLSILSLKAKSHITPGLDDCADSQLVGIYLTSIDLEQASVLSSVLDQNA